MSYFQFLRVNTFQEYAAWNILQENLIICIFLLPLPIKCFICNYVNASEKSVEVGIVQFRQGPKNLQHQVSFFAYFCLIIRQFTEFSEVCMIKRIFSDNFPWFITLSSSKRAKIQNGVNVQTKRAKNLQDQGSFFAFMIFNYSTSHRIFWSWYD